MSALVALGLRLARAGGRLRIVAITFGNLLGAYLLLVSLALPAALYPNADIRTENIVILALVIAMLLIPALMLLIVVGRLSSGVRDRRLAALRLLGITPRRARIVAGVENGVLALGGALAGLLLFLATTPLLNQARFGSPNPVPGTFALSPQRVMLAIAALTALSIAVGTAPTWNNLDLKAARSESAALRPRWWRAGLLLAALAAFGFILSRPPITGERGPWVVTFAVASLLGVLGIAALTPVIARQIAVWWGARSASPAVRLGTRAVEADTASSARVVSGLAVAVVLLSVALGFLAYLENGFAQAIRAAGDGPQRIIVQQYLPPATGSGGGNVTLPANAEVADPRLHDADAVAAALADVPGVRGVLPTRSANVLHEQIAGTLLPVFIGTCDEFALLESVYGYTATGCSDAQPARIVGADGEVRLSRLVSNLLGGAGATSLLETEAVPSSLPVSLQNSMRIWQSDGYWLQQLDDIIDLGEFDTNGATITTAGLVAEEFLPVAFIPVALVEARLASLGVSSGIAAFTATEIVADGGAQVFDQIAAAVAAQGWAALSPTAASFAVYTRIRMVVYALAGLMLTLALVAISLTAIDRAIDRRRNVARQAMIGVPLGVLTRGQLIQVTLPAVVASAIALGFGSLGIRTIMHILNATDVAGNTWATVIGLIAAGITIIGLATIPLARTRLTPDLLRRE